MKRWSILLGVLFTASVFTATTSVFISGSREGPQPDEPISETPGSEESSSAEPDPSQLIESQDDSGLHGSRSSNSTQMLKLADIPEGEFKAGLVKLSEELQRRVLEKLSRNQQLLSDVNSIRVDSGGMIYYVCSFGVDSQDHSEAIEPIDDYPSAGAGVEESGMLVPISSPPALHSRPGAANVLFLDFNGHVIENTAWNTSKGVATWNCLPYDKDGDAGTFNTSELTTITQAWERVAEDYAPFDVDVTTEQPVWTKTTAHALITPGVDANGTACPHNSYGGIAYLDAFDDPRYSYNYGGDCYSPAWVKDYSAASAAEAIAHELGHNLALSHDKLSDGTTTNEYYSGHVNGSISWGPIMGTGYNDDVSQWCKGEYYNAFQSSQDDLAIIADRLNYRPDDHGDNNAGASALIVDSSSGAISQSGVIETTNDPDTFSFSTGAGTINISVNPYRAATGTWGGNLDILLELYDSAGALVATNNPALEVNASLSITVPAGLYYLHVKPVGVGNPMAYPPTGYTSYGSLGQYRISGTVSADADSDGIPNEWETLYFGGFTNAVATADTDGDGADNLTEYISGYDPIDSNSVFEVTSFEAPSSGNSPFILTWNPVEGRLYSAGYDNDLILPPGFEEMPGAIDLPHTQNSYTDTVNRVGPVHFYRVDVRLDQ